MIVFVFVGGIIGAGFASKISKNRLNFKRFGGFKGLKNGIFYVFFKGFRIVLKLIFRRVFFGFLGFIFMKLFRSNC